MNNTRVELHCHTCMSQLNGISSVDDIFDFARKNGMKSIAFTDHNCISAYWEIQDCAVRKYKDIEPIYGVELFVTEDLLPATEKMSKVRYDGFPSYYVIALVKNKKGLNNLFQILTEACTKEDKHPRIAWSRLLELRDGLLLGSAGVGGELFHSIMQENPLEIIRTIASRYDFLEIQPASNAVWLLNSDKTKNITCIEDIQRIQQKIICLGEELNIPVVATSDAHFVSKNNAISREILLNARSWGDERQGDLHIRTTEEMLTEFPFLSAEKVYEVVVTNSNKLADRIETIKPIVYTKYAPEIEDADVKLKRMCEKAAIIKYGFDGKVPQPVVDRIHMELNNIEKWGFAEIYLHYGEIIKKNNLRPSQYGLKGLGASSIVAYLLDISKEDPLSKDCPLYVELFAGEHGNKKPNFDLVVDERIWPQIRESLNGLEGVEEAVWATSCVTPSEGKITSWIEDFEIDQDCIISEPQRTMVRNDLQNVIIANGRRTQGRFFIVPEGKSELLPKARDFDNVENVFPFRWWDMDHMFYTYEIYNSKQRTFLCRLEEESGVSPSDSDIKNPQLIKKLPSILRCPCLNEDIDAWDSILKVKEPETYVDVVRMLSLVHGTGVWKENGEELILNGVLSFGEIITTREDVYEMQLKYKVPKERAYDIEEYIRKGKMHYGRNQAEYEEELLSYGIPQCFVDSFKKIKYLFSRAHAIEHAQMLLRLLYYKQKYGDLFTLIYEGQMKN